MHLEHRGGERLHHGDQPIGDVVGRRLDDATGSSPGEGDRLARERHRRQRLADRVEDLIEQLLAGDRPRHQPGRPHRVGEDLTAGAAQQRPVEVEEGRTSGAVGIADRIGGRVVVHVVVHITHVGVAHIGEPTPPGPPGRHATRT